jgi:hypothetical protein
MACGCNDTALPLANCNDGCDDCPPTNATNLPDCPDDSEPCEELVYADCLKYKGCNLPALGITNNMRMVTLLTTLHKVINDMKLVPLEPIAYTATCTTSTPLKFTYLSYGPTVSKSGVSSAAAVLTMASTANLVVGMKASVTSGTGTIGSSVTISSIDSATQVTLSSAPSVALSAAVVKFVGSDHTAYTTTVVQNSPLAITAFLNSPVILSGTGTIA